MSYYRPSYSQTVAMSRGGRGFSSSRSSYRGSGGRGNSWGSGRGNYNSRGNSGARFSSFSNSFESRSKYPGSSEKYGARGHDEEFRKPYKGGHFKMHRSSLPVHYNDSGGYSGREHRGSPERKRMRTGSSHDRSFGGSGDYNNSRYETDRRSFSSDRRPAPFVRKEEFRKPPPPTSSPRRGYRGRISTRGSLRARLRERPARRRLVESSYAVRRPVMSGRTSDYARRLKMPRMRSSILRRPKKDELSEKEESEGEEEEEEETKADKSEDKEGSDKEEIDEEKKASPKKSTPKKEDGAVSEKEEGKESAEEEEEEKPTKSTFIKLKCTHCLTRCPTFGQYNLHLQSGRHAAAMRKVALKQKAILGQMRLVQRKAQRELEKTTDDLAPRTSWCQLCKLNYKQPKLTHQATQAHKDMKKFLMPFCKICKITFKSPMIYESHCCSIDHIKRKALLSNGDKSDNENVSANEEDVMENFMTIDSVGDMDEEGEPTEKKEGAEPKVKKQINVGLENIRKVEVHYCDLCRMYLPRAHDDEEMQKILASHCKLRTHLQKYIRYKEDKELAKRAERLQRKETAEKEKEKDKEEVKVEAEVKEDDKKEPVEKSDACATAEEEKMWADVDKDLGDILAEAGSDILAEANSCHKSSDEDEEDSVVNGERYDRFKYSEKSEEIVKKEVVKENEEEKKPEEVEAAK